MEEAANPITRAIEAVTTAAKTLEDVQELVRIGQSRPDWQPVCPHLDGDQDLIRRFASRLEQLDESLKNFVTTQNTVLANEKGLRPFSCPSALKKRIDDISGLLDLCRLKDAPRILRACSRVPRVISSIPGLPVLLLRLTRLTNHGGPQEVAKEAASALAYEKTKEWVKHYLKEMKKCLDIWDDFSQGLQSGLEKALAQRQTLEQDYNAKILERFKDRLQPFAFKIAEGIALVGESNAEARALLAEEDNSFERLRRPWLSAQAVETWAYRSRSALGSPDRALAHEWAGSHGSGKYWVSAMESARTSELVALTLYRELYGAAEDLSIQQVLLGSSDTRWKRADIATDGRWIDVKNARRAYSSPNTYSEHCVPSFKSDRSHLDVAISGFLAPYDSDSRDPILWLGEITAGSIDRLRQEFQKDWLEITFSSASLRGPRTLLPPWLFDYPEACYAERNRALNHIRTTGFLWPRKDCPWGVYAVAGCLTSVPGDNVTAVEAAELRRRIKRCGLGRAVLFLHVLDNFCRSSIQAKPFAAKSMRQILFPYRSGEHVVDEHTPLAVSDPMGTVGALVDLLERVSNHCREQVVQFQAFKLSGPGILRGRLENGAWQTIFAYCGGWRKRTAGSLSQIRCGQNPVFIGQDDPCTSCNRLICNKCGYCAELCHASRPRQEQWPT